ncbi:MAG TPA: hypothetical protein VMW83_11490 [Spirochaetia bacterium]|nr:hypothetical protein [Spirochaetia bacterium]
MEPPEDVGQVRSLTEGRKDLIAGALFLGMCLIAILSFRLQHIPITLPAYKITIFKDFTRDLFVFRPH